MSYHKILGLGLLFALSVLLASCGSEPEPTATTMPEIAPREIADRAAEAMLTLNSLHFTVERDGSLVYIDDGGLLAFKRAEGDFVQPDQMRAKVRIITAITRVDIGMIVLGNDQYATDPFTGHWGILPEDWGQFNLAVLFDPQIGIRGLLREGIIDLLVLGVDKIEGQLHYHLAGRADGVKMHDMTLGFIGDGDVDLEVWIGAEDFHVRRLYITETESDPDDPTTWDLNFSNLGQPVEIEAPPISRNELIPANNKSQTVLTAR